MRNMKNDVINVFMKRSNNWAAAAAARGGRGAVVCLCPDPAEWGSWSIRDVLNFELGLVRLSDLRADYLSWVSFETPGSKAPDGVAELYGRIVSGLKGVSLNEGY